MKSGSFSLRRRMKSFVYAFRGILHVARSEHNFWIHLSAAIGVILLGFWLKVSTSEWLWIVFSIGLVFTAETFNTAIEKLVDLYHPSRERQAGLIKDIAAGGVLVMAITAAVIGIIIFLPKLIAICDCI